MKQSDYDLDICNEIKNSASELEGEHADKIELQRQMENLYLLNWDEATAVKNKIKGRKLTIHPGPRNAIMGYVRLLAATDPEFQIPRNVLEIDQTKNADMLEKAAKHIWTASGTVRTDPTHYDILRSAAIYGEIMASVIDTKDYLAKMEANGTPAERARAQRIADLTPFTYDVINPRMGYPVWDTFGLTHFYAKRRKRVRNLITEYGEDALDALGDSYNPYDFKDEHEWWDLQYHYIWIEDFEAPVVFTEHGKKEIPVVCTLVEGSRLFPDPADQRNPFLYTYLKSGLWHRANLALTVIYSNIFQIGANPLFVFKQATEGQKIEVDRSVPGDAIIVPPGADWYPVVNQGVIDPSIKEGLDIAVGLEEESTVYKQTLGQPLGPNSAYAMVSLLSQTGRLPLVLSQRKAQYAIGELMRRSFMIMKENGRTFETESLGQNIKVTPDMIPNNLQVNAILDIAQPQDALQNANVAAILDEKGLASKEWIQENILGIGQTKQMNFDIMSERSFMVHYENYIKTLIRQYEMMEETDRMMMEQVSQLFTGGQQQPVAGVNPQMGQAQQVLPQNARREPVVQGLPQEMMQGGNRPPEEAAMAGQRGVPPGGEE